MRTQAPPVRPTNRRLRLEKLQDRNLLAADFLLFEDIQDRSADGFDSIGSNAASEGAGEIDAYVDNIFGENVCRKDLRVVSTQSGDTVLIRSGNHPVVVATEAHDLTFEAVDRIHVDPSEAPDRLIVEPALADKLVRIQRTEDVSFERELWGISRVDEDLPTSSSAVNADDSKTTTTPSAMSDVDRFDVNNDGQVTAIDALQVINALNSNGSKEDDQFASHDVTADGLLTTHDALQIINFLIRNNSPEHPAPELVDYVSFQGDQYQLYAYVGDHVRLLADSPDLHDKNIAELIAEIDRGYKVYMDVTGREPFDHGTSIGKTDIARVAETCGAGCGYLGIRGIEIDDRFFDQAINEYARSGRPDHVFFYEMGRNFWFYHSKLEFNDQREDTSTRGSGDFMVNGFPILMERAISEFLDIEFSGPLDGAGTQEFREANARWLKSYIDSPDATFDSVFLDFQGSLYDDPIAGGGYMGTMDFFAEIMLDVARDYGRLAFLKRFWQEVAQRPDMTDIDSAISNLVDSASLAAGEDLHDRFIEKYKWNTINYSKRFENFDLEGRDEFRGGGLLATYQPGSPFTLINTLPVEQRIEPTVDHEWGWGGPSTIIGDDHFSGTWKGEIFFPTVEEYTFRVFADDGVRLWIDDQLIIDAWQPQRQEVQGTFTPNATEAHRIRLEYFEKTGAATIQLNWESSVVSGLIPEAYLRVDHGATECGPPVDTRTHTEDPAHRDEVASDSTFRVDVDSPRYFYEPIHISDSEQAMIETVNRIRQDPKAWEAIGDVALNDGLAPGTISGDPLPPLAPNQRLSDAAEAHSRDMLENHYLDHVGLDGMTPSNRASEYGYEGSVAENVGLDAYDYNDIDNPNENTERRKQHVAQAVVYMLMDSPDHRANLLGHHKEIGVGIELGDFAFPSGRVWPVLMATQKFGHAADTPFLTGVAYDDLGLGYYIAGRGAEGVLISAIDSENRRFETVTGASGGYTLPLPPGSYELTATNSDQTVVLALGTVTVSNVNVKVDVISTRFTNPAVPPHTIIALDGADQ